MMGMTMGMFPQDMGNGKLSGCIIKGEGYTPSMNGALLYFNANPDMSGAIGRVETAGGKVLMPKTQVSPEIGFMAIFVDSEGNKVAMHSQN